VTNGVAGGVQNIYTIGPNWCVNRNVRFMVNYLHGTVDKFSGAAATAGAEIGALFDALAIPHPSGFLESISLLDEGRAYAARLPELDLAIDLERKIELPDGHGCLRGQRLVTLQTALGQGLAYRLLNLALGGDPERLEELADARIENVLVHDQLPDERRQFILTIAGLLATLARSA
jgi:Phosphate-selective porin O and P